MDDYYFMKEAINEAHKSLLEGGIPIGSVLVENGEIISRGHNRLVQNDSAILHGEMDTIENAGRLKGVDYKKTSFYTTLSPCPMCAGAMILYNIPRVVIGENTTLMGAEDLLRDNSVEVVVLNMDEAREILEEYIQENPNQWDEELERVGSKTTLK
jgi:cytosine deaminase